MSRPISLGDEFTISPNDPWAGHVAIGTWRCVGMKGDGTRFTLRSPHGARYGSGTNIGMSTHRRRLMRSMERAGFSVPWAGA